MTKEKLRKKVIELIHGLPYEEAVMQEQVEGCTLLMDTTKYKEHPSDYPYCGKFKHTKKVTALVDIGGIRNDTAVFFNSDIIMIECGDYKTLGLPVTIGRVIQAFKSKNIALCLSLKNMIAIQDFNKESEWLETDAEWKLTKENGQECTLEDQSDETIEKLWELLKN